MTPVLDVVGLVVADLPASLAFYRRLGLDIPPDAERGTTSTSPSPAACA
jgi:catechol 2,3-dioxygenase-like lactoylglutathione lyase family enzyme